MFVQFCQLGRPEADVQRGGEVRNSEDQRSSGGPASDRAQPVRRQGPRGRLPISQRPGRLLLEASQLLPSWKLKMDLIR